MIPMDIRTGFTAIIASAVFTAGANLVVHFPMTVVSGQIEETVSGERFDVEGHFSPENLPGASGEALRFDGYTSFVDASLRNLFPAGTGDMTVSLWTALPCYPIIEIDKDTSLQTPIATCLDENARTGFGFYVGFNGKWSFRTFIGGWPVTVDIDTPLPVYTWNCLTAVLDSSTRSVRVYNNGVEVGSARANGNMAAINGRFLIGRGKDEIYSGPFLLTSFNGLIDDIRIWDEALPQSEIEGWTAENPADLSIPASRFAGDLLRPRFHGMPEAAWTNECHGMVWKDGRYHLFFQKNANGPYMARLHIGHIVSENLYDWTEEPIAIAPGDWYDIKGTWSGCVFTDEQITGGEPNIIYTGVDYARATIDQAAPADETLVKWDKKTTNPIINGRPAGLSDDFRDPYFFRNDDNAYIIVGSSKDGNGTATLHRYDSQSGLWSNNGDLFFTGSNPASDGNFWEMPNITPMGDGRWLFTATPLRTSTGTRTLYWTGSINDDGTFRPASGFSSGRSVELIAREGFGLLSPTVYPHDGKVLALGIVPDKLSSQENWNLGWAHCYSLPREWSLSQNGELIQKPFEGLKGMRSSTSFSMEEKSLDGTESLAPVSGRAAEILGTFTVGSTPFGFNIFKSGASEGKIIYNPSIGELTLDFTGLNRLVNDAGTFDGLYRCSLPVTPKAGEELKLNLFIDHSIIDIFINDRWATSVRVFPTDPDADGIEVFGNGVAVKSLKGWTLRKGESGVREIHSSGQSERNGDSEIYHISGRIVKSGENAAVPEESLNPGIYVRDGRKVIVR